LRHVAHAIHTDDKIVEEKALDEKKMAASTAVGMFARVLVDYCSLAVWQPVDTMTKMDGYFHATNAPKYLNPSTSGTSTF
jgi:hypothetical protein